MLRFLAGRGNGTRGRRLAGRVLVVALLALAGASSLVGVAPASESPPIEGIWSFNGGEVAIAPAGNGTFTGTVVAQTRFAQCSHPVGQQMWTDIHPQPDGSYWGFHQWYFENEQCTPNPTLGPTAWRVLQAPGGAHYLLVCFSGPGQGQPTIAADGSSTNVSHPPCVQSALVRPLTSVAGLKSAFVLPGSAKCFSKRHFPIHVVDPRYDPLKRIVVTLAKRRINVVRRGSTFAASIDLRGLPRGAFTVTIRGVTVLGHKVLQRRTYHTCIARRISVPKRPAKAHHRRK